MLKKTIATTILAGVITFVTFGAVKTVSAAQDQFVHGYGSQSSPGAYGQSIDPASRMALLPTGELSEAEEEALLFMREEEKLAHDVYIFLYKKWGLGIFQNIANSEQTHADTIAMLLERYNLSDPASATAGIFTNPDLQVLYTQLTAKGSQSLADALKVGGLIEEVDIRDLKSSLAEADNADIQQVFTNLLNGSYNHLLAFSSTFTRQTGETYQPQVLSLEDYQSITSGSSVNGSQVQGQRGRRGF